MHMNVYWVLITKDNIFSPSIYLFRLTAGQISKGVSVADLINNKYSQQKKLATKECL